jgi:hypothetical protein
MVIKIGIIKIAYWGKGKLMISSTCVLYQILASGSRKEKRIKLHILASKISILHRRLTLLRLQTRPEAFIIFKNLSVSL